jgi:outer membrane protein assembly factor BamE (lipoprotein component of BamABCDE complex)
MRAIILIVAATQLLGCSLLQSYGQDRDLTVGTVQKEIRIGMSGAEVAAALGSPNIVSTDEYRNEVWIYDKISSHSVQTQTHTAPATLMLFDSLGSITTTSSNQRNSSSQRSLTVIIKFDEDGKVYDFAYHTSRF